MNTPHPKWTKSTKTFVFIFNVGRGRMLQGGGMDARITKKNERGLWN